MKYSGLTVIVIIIFFLGIASSAEDAFGDTSDNSDGIMPVHPVDPSLSSAPIPYGNSNQVSTTAAILSEPDLPEENEAPISSSISYISSDYGLEDQGSDPTLIAYYPFSGDADDSSGYGHHGTVYGANLTTDRFGNPAGAFEFDGIDDYIDLGLSDDMKIQEAITLSAWVKAPPIPAGTLWAIISSQCDDPTDTGASINIDGRISPDGQPSPARHLHFQIGDNNWHSTNSNSVIPENEWVFLVATRQTGQPAEIYYNGIPQPLTSEDWSGEIVYVNNWSIGRQADLGRYFKGCIDDVRIYNRTLLQSEVILLQTGNPVYPDRVLNTSHVPVYVIGTNFTEGIVVDLEQDETGIARAQAITIRDPTLLLADFDLTGIEAGTYDIRVRWPDSTELFLPSSLMVMSRIKGYYSFSNSAEDSSGYGHDGSVYGATLTADRYGNPASAYDFDGIDDYIDLGLSDDMKIQEAITLSAWVKAPPIPANTLWAVVSSQRDNPTHTGASINIDGRISPDGQPSPARHLHFQIGDNNWHSTNSNSVVPENEWVFLVATRQAGEPARIYYNGILQPLSSADWSGKIVYVNNWSIGRQADLGRYFKGCIDDVRIYHDALTAPEVISLYSGGRPVYPDAIFPSSNTRFTLFGSNFTDGLIIEVENSGTVVARADTIEVNDPSMLTAYFDLSMAQPGMYDIRIRWPDSSELFFPASLTLKSKIVAQYNFNGNASDLSGNGHDGTVHGAALVPDKNGNSAGAYEFDGIDDYINVNYSPDFDPPSFTITAWAKFTGSGDDYQHIISKHVNYLGSREGYGLQYQKISDNFNFFTGEGGSGYDHINSGIVEPGVWYFIAGTFDGNEKRLYIDDSLVGMSSTTVVHSPNDLTIGCGGQFGSHYPQFGDFFKGTIDDITIYNQSLTSDEIRNLYLQTSNRSFIVSPRTVTNTFHVKIQIYGKNLTEGIQVNLERDGSFITAAEQVFRSSSTMLVATFNLSSIPLGECDVTIQWPDGTRHSSPGALSIKSLPEGVIFENTNIKMSAGTPQTFTFTVPETQNLFVTLQKVQYPGDPHWSWDGRLALVQDDTEVANSHSNQDQIIHLVNPEPGEYNLTATSDLTGSGILKVWTALPAFPDGNWVVDPIYRPYGSTFRQIEIEPGKSSLTFNAQAIGTWSRFDVYQGQWGNGQHWISSSGPEAALTIPNPPAGLYIVQFMDTQMITGDDQYREVMLKASTTGTIEPPPVYLPMISSFTPTRGGNAGTITMEIKGAWLEPNASVDLTQHGKPVVSALSVNGSPDKRILTAVLDLTNQPAGSYNVTVTNPDGTMINGNIPFIIEEGGRSEFWTEIFGRETIRAGRPATYIINYGNNGTLDMPAPLISLATDPPSSSIYIRLPPSTEWREMNGPFTVIARGPDENPDILPAGSSYSMEIEVNTNEYGEFTLVSLPYGGDPVFTPRTIESVIDADAPAPGIPLTFGRTYPGGYSLHQGPFGYGWVHTYDLQLERFGDGNYGVRNGDAYMLLYLQQVDGTFQSETGDSNLTFNVDGTSVIWMRDGSALTFNANRRPVTISDLNGNQITIVYTGNQLTGIRHSDGDQFTLVYGPNGKIIRLIDHAEKETIYSYSPDSTLLTSVTAPDGSITQYTYTTGETGIALIQIDYPGGFTQRYQNDGDGRLVATSLNNKEVIPLSYSEEERTTTMSDTLGASVMVKVNEAGQPVRTENALGATQQFIYNGAGDSVRAIDPLGNSYQIEYDDQHNPTSIINPSGYTTIISYEDQFNKVDSVTDDRGNALAFSYDTKGNLAGITYPDSHSETLVYDEDGNVIRKTTRKGDIINYQYNSRGQLTRVDYPDGTYLSYTYDSSGNMLTASNQAGTISFEYNTRNQPVRILYPDGNSFNYTHNDAGFLTERIEKDGYTTIYSYDDAGNLIRVSDGTGSVIVSYTYDAAGKLIRKAVRNGAYTIYEYDLSGRLNKLKNYNKNDEILSRFEYQYDISGYPLILDVSEGRFQYDYDAIGQLIKVIYPDGHITQFSYDSAGNRCSMDENSSKTEYLANSMNQIVQAGPTVFSYDANGNLIQKNVKGNITTYQYDYENRLSTISSSEGSLVFTYDAFGNRIGKKVNDEQIWYSVDPLGMGDVLAEYNDKRSLIARYTHGLGLISKIDSGGKEYTYEFDAMGHTSEMIDSENTIVNRYRYTPSGEYIIKLEGTENSFTFVGESGVMDDCTGLYFMQYRYYSPITGQFITPDTLGIFSGRNLYTYVRNRLTTHIDPLGLSDHEWWESKEELIETIEGGHYNVEQPDVVGMVLEEGAKQVAGQVCDTIVPGSGQIIDIIDVAGGINDAQDPSSKASATLPLPNIPYDKGTDPQFGEWKTKNLERLIKAKNFAEQRANPTPESWKEPSRPKLVPYKEAKSEQNSESTGPRDPEDKFGPTGYDPAGIPRDQLKRHIAAGTSIKYRIDFWNAENATGTVCDVWAHDQLDSDLNWSTFGFTSVGFMNWTVPLDGVPSFEVYVDTRPDMNYTVRITGDYNPSTGNITLEYNTLDPVTLETPEDPLAGFLPPIASNEIGWFEFSVQPDPGLHTGTKLENQAWVKFDNLEFFPAPPDGPWVNTIDAGAPSCNVLVSLANGTEMVCTFSGSDDSGGSGIKDYTIFMSDNGGPFQSTLNHVKTSPATLNGVPGHTYRFYSVARDNIGNTESAPAAPDSTLTIPIPSTMTLVSPNGGENSLQGSNRTVQWTYTGSPGPLVMIELLNGTAVDKVISSGTPIGSGGFGSCIWNISSNQTLGSDFRIRITSTSDAACTDTSDAPFTISSGAAVTVVTPNGGETWQRGSPYAINWTYTGSPGSMVMIELLQGMTVNQIISSNTTIGSGGLGSCNWTIPYNQTPGPDYKIRIASTSNPAYSDTSNAPFTIGPGSPITVASPNGGEKWQQGSTQTIRWNYTDDPGAAVKIEALRGTKVLATVTPSYPIGTNGTGWYNLTFPYGTPLGSDYFIRVTSTSNASYTDTSDAPFTVIPPITVASPNGGEEWQQGSTQTIRWTYIGDPGPTVKIEAMRGDSVLATITPGTSAGSGGSGSMNLTLPMNAPLGTDFRIRISSTSNAIYTDTSDAPFTIVANTGSSLSVVSPNGGENYVQGSTQTIMWNYTGNPGSAVKIEALRGGTVLATVASSYPIGSSGSGSYDLKFPYSTPVGSDYRIKVTSTSNPAWSDTSGEFTISPAITVLSPDGGEEWNQGSMHPITWTYSGNPGTTVKIEALRNDKVLAVVTPSTPIASGSYNLTFPLTTPLGSGYQIRVTSTSYPACSDTSNGVFTIVAP